MTNENLQITCVELMQLKQQNPLEVEVILEMLSEAGEDYYVEMAQSEKPLQSVSL